MLEGSQENNSLWGRSHESHTTRAVTKEPAAHGIDFNGFLPPPIAKDHGRHELNRKVLFSFPNAFSHSPWIQ